MNEFLFFKEFMNKYLHMLRVLQGFFSPILHVFLSYSAEVYVALPELCKLKNINIKFKYSQIRVTNTNVFIKMFRKFHYFLYYN